MDHPLKGGRCVLGRAANIPLIGRAPGVAANPDKHRVSTHIRLITSICSDRPKDCGARSPATRHLRHITATAPTPTSVVPAITNVTGLVTRATPAPTTPKVPPIQVPFAAAAIHAPLECWSAMIPTPFSPVPVARTLPEPNPTAVAARSAQVQVPARLSSADSAAARTKGFDEVLH